jgi:hypothetical protein
MTDTESRAASGRPPPPQRERAADDVFVGRVFRALERTFLLLTALMTIADGSRCAPWSSKARDTVARQARRTR